MQYLVRTAREAGVDARFVPIARLTFNQSRGGLIDRAAPAAPITHAWKLYPYEWLCYEEIGAALSSQAYRPHRDTGKPRDQVGTQFLEPPWKLVLGNKALLVLLWQLYARLHLSSSSSFFLFFFFLIICMTF